MSNTQHNDAPADSLPGNEPILTDAEKALLAEVDQPVPAATQGDPPPAAPAATDVTETPPPGGVSASADLEPAVPAASAAEPASTSLPALQQDARDFKAEREALDSRYSEQLSTLKTKFTAGEIDDDQYEEQRDAIIQARTDERDELTAARVKYETRAELAEEFAEHTWKQNVQTFLAQPENVLLTRSPTMQQLWQATMQRAVNEAAEAGKPLVTDAQIMIAGRDLMLQELGLSAPSTVTPPATPAAAAPAAPAPKPPKLDDIPPSIGALPGAAPNGAALTGDELAGMDISNLEGHMAGMSEAAIDQLLRATPGAFVD